MIKNKISYIRVIFKKYLKKKKKGGKHFNLQNMLFILENIK